MVGPFCITMYLDDLLALLAMAADAVALAAALFDLFHRLGIKCHCTKLQADPVSCIQHLGFMVDVTGCQLLLCPWQYEKLHARMTALLYKSGCRKWVVGKRSLAWVVG